MSTASRTNILLEATSLSLRIARKHMAPYSCRNSPQKFTQEQLLTCLILRVYLKTTYRGLIEFLEVSDSVRKRLGLTTPPHYSTLKKFADRSSVLEIVDVMLHELVQKFTLDDEEAAIDSTGLETTSASAHFQSRSGKQRTRYVKLSVWVLVGSLIPSGLAVSWGPGNDKAEAPEVLAKAAASLQPKTLFADAGYDAEWVYRFCREDWQVDSVIKPAVRQADGGLNGHYRSQMTEARLKEKNYGKWWLVESFMSGLKRTTGSALTSRNDRSLFVEAALRVLAHTLKRWPETHQPTTFQQSKSKPPSSHADRNGYARKSAGIRPLHPIHWWRSRFHTEARFSGEHRLISLRQTICLSAL